MQNDPNRLLQKSDTIAKFGDDGAISLAKQAILDGLILHPNMPAIHLADVLLEETPAEIANSLTAILLRDFYVRGILVERRKQSATTRTDARLPGFEHLPLKIPTAGGKRVRLLSANVYGVREYYRLLMARHRDRRNDDPQIKETKNLLDVMRKHSRTEKGITVREVLLIEQ